MYLGVNYLIIEPFAWLKATEELYKPKNSIWEIVLKCDDEGTLGQEVLQCSCKTKYQAKSFFILK